MNKAHFSDEITKLCTVQQAKERYKLGRNTIMNLASKENAIRRFGRAVRIDIEVLDRAFELY